MSCYVYGRAAACRRIERRTDSGHIRSSQHKHRDTLQKHDTRGAEIQHCAFNARIRCMVRTYVLTNFISTGTNLLVVFIYCGGNKSRARKSAYR